MKKYDISKFHAYSGKGGRRGHSRTQISLTKTGIGIPKGIGERMGSPEFIRVLLEEKGRRIALVVAQQDDSNALNIVKAKAGNFRIHSKGLITEIAHAWQFVPDFFVTQDGKIGLMLDAR